MSTKIKTEIKSLNLRIFVISSIIISLSWFSRSKIFDWFLQGRVSWRLMLGGRHAAPTEGLSELWSSNITLIPIYKGMCTVWRSVAPDFVKFLGSFLWLGRFSGATRLGDKSQGLLSEPYLGLRGYFAQNVTRISESGAISVSVAWWQPRLPNWRIVWALE